MSKELEEALKRVNIRCHPKVEWDDPIDFDLETIKQALLQAEKDKLDYLRLKSTMQSNIDIALETKTKKEQAFDCLIKYFNITCNIDPESDGEIWARFVNIQAKEDEGTWDTTATANLVDYKEDFDLLKSLLEE